LGEIARLLEGHGAVSIDTNCFVYHLQADRYPRQAPVVAELFDMVEKGQIMGVTSPIAIVEIMTWPRKLGLEEVAYQYKMLLTNFPHLQIPEINTSVADRAAALRGVYHLRTPDALQIATGMVYGASIFVTFDAELERVSASFPVAILKAG